MSDELTPITHKCSACGVNTECAVAPRVHAWERQLKEMHTVICGDMAAENPDGIVHKIRRHELDLYGKDGSGGLKAVAREYTLDKAKATGFVAAVGAVSGLVGAWLADKLHR
jgi:hypothetical protein